MSTNPHRAIVCPSCGRLIARSDPRCPLCGQRAPGLAARGSLLDRVFSGVPSPSKLLIQVNVALYVVQVLVSLARNDGGGGSTMLAPSPDTMIAFGALEPGLVLESHQWWRLISCTFIHGNLIHILFNMWMLRLLGRNVEEIFGRARFYLLYFGSGVFASAVSCWRLHETGGFSVGASGAVFGLLGVLAAWGLRRGGLIGKAVFRQMAFLALINLLLGGMMARVDNWAHGGGLAAGFLLGLWLRSRDLSPRGETPRIRLAAVAVLAVVVGCLGVGSYHLVRGSSSGSLAIHEARRRWPMYATHVYFNVANQVYRMDPGSMAREARELAEWHARFENAAEALGEDWLHELVRQQRELETLLRSESASAGEVQRLAVEIVEAMVDSPWETNLTRRTGPPGRDDGNR